MKELNLYIHIPFCKQKCYYCDFISYPNKDDYIENYIDTLINEYRNYKAEEYSIKTIYIGGGTPSYIDSKYIIKLLKEINLDNAEEITIEVNPGTVTREKLIDYKNVGINRLSIGLQATQDSLLKSKKKFDELPDNLKEIAELRLANPDANLVELGQMLDTPISKSGANHRLNKILKIAEELKK